MDLPLDKRMLKVKRDLLNVYHLLASIMEDEDPAVSDMAIAAKLSSLVDNLEAVMREVSEAMEHHTRSQDRTPPYSPARTPRGP